MKLARWPVMLAAAALAAVSVFTGTSSAAAAPGPAETARAGTAAVAAAAEPTEPKYFLGSGYGPYNIALDAAYGTAYAAAANEGYPSSSCRLSAGPVPNELSPGYFQILLEIHCVPPAPAGAGRIVGVHSGKCLDVKAGGTANGTPVQIYSCNNGSNQSWKLYPDGTLRSLGRCLDVQYARTENGSLLGMNSCHGAPNQQWQLLEGGLLRSAHSGKCLDALGWGTGNGTRVGIWDCAPHHTNQQWQGPGLGT
ncbi:RICIN domain-containing protein [Streptomyces zhihengii]|uniref:Ricin-type beta-trefoil lectin domain protein n=1 Tax=Streptomyces zhihengii TaxID=1818004 RepID=A0ABS2ULF3_9ACTN|nr:RICIN domain-containing protein [Streptomyces zhihengii]MBM9618367.1 ricin-type beta-trefoil lectin domain protein [Streptomyces zhihengii]